MNITVYLGSSMGNTEFYEEKIIELGKWLASHNHQLVYGGSKAGLMGVLADTVLEQGGKVYGILPDFMQKREQAYEGLTNLQIVSSMDERKRLLMEEGDVLVAFPGGPGTLEEIIQAISWVRIGTLKKPCLLLNLNGYYDNLKAQFDQMVTAGFLTSKDREIAVFIDSLHELEEFITQYQK